MNAKLIKKIRKFVRETYPFMSEVPIYMTDAHGVVRLHQTCQRAFVQNIKRNIKDGVTITNE